MNKATPKLLFLISLLLLFCMSWSIAVSAWSEELEKQHDADNYEEYKQLLKKKSVPYDFVKYRAIKELGEFGEFCGALDFQSYCYSLNGSAEDGYFPIEVHITHIAPQAQEDTFVELLTRECTIDRVANFPNMQRLDVSDLDPIRPGCDPMTPYSNPFWVYYVEADELVYYYSYTGELSSIMIVDPGNELKISISAARLEGLSSYPADADTLLSELLYYETKDAAMRQLIFRMMKRRTVTITITIGLLVASASFVIFLAKRKKRGAPVPAPAMAGAPAGEVLAGSDGDASAASSEAAPASPESPAPPEDMATNDPPPEETPPPDN